MSESMSVIDLMQKATELSGNYENVVLSVINDHVVRISLMTEPYFWHLHPNSDETFNGLEGTVILELEHQRIELSVGQMFTVPNCRRSDRIRDRLSALYYLRFSADQSGRQGMLN
jgi:hypothetical protein